jgi:SAM-dependent methyltransferase
VEFSGEVAAAYARYRRGFPPAVVDELVRALDLPPDAFVLDLGCGTGQLTVPLAGRYARVAGADPSPDMLALARSAAPPGIGWLLAADTDLDRLPLLAGLDAVTISQAIHLMDAPALFGVLARRLSGRGRVALVANGGPMWLGPAPWARALRAYLEGWLGRPLTATCGTSAADRARYRAQLAAAGFGACTVATAGYAEELTAEAIAGNVISALSPARLPADRAGFERELAAALPPGPYVEDVRVSILVARRLPS